MSVTTTLLDHLQATLLYGVDESAHPPLKYSHPFLLQQLSQVCQSTVCCDLAIDRALELVANMLNWVEIRRVRRAHHSLQSSRTSQELSHDSPPVRAGVIVHKDETTTNGSCMWYNMHVGAEFQQHWMEFKFPFVYISVVLLFLDNFVPRSKERVRQFFNSLYMTYRLISLFRHTLNKT